MKNFPEHPTQEAYLSHKSNYLWLLNGVFMLLNYVPGVQRDVLPQLGLQPTPCVLELQLLGLHQQLLLPPHLGDKLRI